MSWVWGEATQLSTSLRLPAVAASLDSFGGVESYLSGNDAPAALPALSAQLPATAVFVLSGPE